MMYSKYSHILTFLAILYISPMMSCSESDDAEFVPCRSLVASPHEIDSLNYDIIKSALNSVFLTSNILLQRTNEVFLEQDEMTSDEIILLYNDNGFENIVENHSDIFDRVNSVNDKRKLQFEWITDFPWSIELSEWECLKEHNPEPKRMYDAIEDFVGYKGNGSVFDCSLPGFSFDSSYAMVVSIVKWLRPAEKRGDTEKRYIIMERDSLDNTYHLYTEARRWIE